MDKKRKKGKEKVNIVKLINNIIESKIATILFLFIVAVICVKLAILPAYNKYFGGETTIITKSTLTDVIKTSQISTYQMTYNGVAKKVKKGEKKVAYLVNYEANIKAGVDMRKIEIMSIEDNKISIKLPAIEIEEPNVDMQKLDYIFYDKSEDKEGVTNEAYKLAVNDAKMETKNNKAIKKLAEDNLKRLLKALIDPLIEENGNKYTYDWSVENEK
jgi:hypothetical protein